MNARAGNPDDRRRFVLLTGAGAIGLLLEQAIECGVVGNADARLGDSDAFTALFWVDYYPDRQPKRGEQDAVAMAEVGGSPMFVAEFPAVSHGAARGNVRLSMAQRGGRCAASA